MPNKISFVGYCLEWIDKNLEKRNPTLAGIIKEFLLQREEEYEELEAQELYEEFKKEIEKTGLKPTILKCKVCGEEKKIFNINPLVKGAWKCLKCGGDLEVIKEI